MAGASVVNRCGKAADLPGVHRGRNRIPETSGTAGARAVLSARARGISATNHVEPVECLHQRVQGAGADSAVQGHGEAGGLSAIGPPFVTLQQKLGVRSVACLTEGRVEVGPYAAVWAVWGADSNDAQSLPASAALEYSDETSSQRILSNPSLTVLLRS